MLPRLDATASYATGSRGEGLMRSEVNMSKFLPLSDNNRTRADRTRRLRRKLGPVLASLGWEEQPGSRLVFKRKQLPGGPCKRSLSRHPPDDRLRWAEIAAMGGHWQARTVAPSSLQGLPSAKSVTPALSASEMSISRSSRRTSPLVLADTHDSRTPHAGAGSGGGRSCEISRRISANSILGTATSAIWKAT